MNPLAMIDVHAWNRALLIAELLVVVAAMSMIFGRTSRDRLFAMGVLTQGIAMAFSAAGEYFPRADLLIPAIAVLALLGLWCAWLLSSRRIPQDAQSNAVTPGVDGQPPLTNAGSGPELSEWKNIP